MTFLSHSVTKILGIYFSSITQASNIKKNWIERLEKCKRTIKQWEKRNLSIFGKVTVIKTFLQSQFIYLMRCLVLPEDALSEINTLFYRFLWRRKNANRKAFEKVKRKVLITDYSKGGLNMVDMKIKQTSFQLEWMIKIYKADISEKYAWIPKLYFSVFGKHLAILNTTVGIKRFKGLENLHDSVWKNNLIAWIIHNKENSYKTKNQCIWNNKNIMYLNSVIHFANWSVKGITYVSDVFSNDSFISFDNLAQKIGRSAALTLQYPIVRNAIQSFIRLDNENNDYQPLHFNDKVVSTAHAFYQYISDSNNCTPTSKTFWQNKFNISIEKTHWLLAIITTKESRLRELHWKILNNIYPTNILLSKI